MSDSEIAQELLSWFEGQEVEPEDTVPIMVAAIAAIIKSTSNGDRRTEELAAARAAQQILDQVAGEQEDPGARNADC